MYHGSTLTRARTVVSSISMRTVEEMEVMVLLAV